MHGHEEAANFVQVAVTCWFPVFAALLLLAQAQDYTFDLLPHFFFKPYLSRVPSQGLICTCVCVCSKAFPSCLLLYGPPGSEIS